VQTSNYLMCLCECWTCRAGANSVHITAAGRDGRGGRKGDFWVLHYRQSNAGGPLVRAASCSYCM